MGASIPSNFTNNLENTEQLPEIIGDDLSIKITEIIKKSSSSSMLF